MTDTNKGPRLPEPPRTPGTHTDINVTKREEFTVNAGPNRRGWRKNIPQNAEEWKRLGQALLPWAAGGAILLLAGSAAVRNARCDKDDMSVGEFARRKGRRAGDAVDDAKDSARRGWFGLKRRTSNAADDVANRAQETGDAARRKAREAKGYVKDKAEDVKEGARETGWWASEKAHDAADATKSAARSTVDATTRVAKQAEEKIAAGGSAVLAGASKAEEKTGAVLKDAGDKLEKDGRQSKQFYRGEEVKHEGKKKWFGLF